MKFMSFFNRRYLALWLWHLLVLPIAAQMDCNPLITQGHFKFDVLLYMKQQAGSSDIIITDKRNLTKYMGSCRNVDQMATKMTSVMETFGFNMTVVKNGEFRLHNTDNYLIGPVYVSNNGSFKLVMASVNGFAESTGNEVYESGWALVVKRDVQGSKGIIESGSSIRFGVYR